MSASGASVASLKMLSRNNSIEAFRLAKYDFPLQPRKLVRSKPGYQALSLSQSGILRVDVSRSVAFLS